VVHLSPGWSQAMPFHTWPGWHCPTIAGTHPLPCGVCPRGHGCAGAAAAQGRAGCAFPPTGSVGGGWVHGSRLQCFGPAPAGVPASAEGDWDRHRCAGGENGPVVGEIPEEVLCGVMGLGEGFGEGVAVGGGAEGAACWLAGGGGGGGGGCGDPFS